MTFENKLPENLIPRHTFEVIILDNNYKWVLYEISDAGVDYKDYAVLSAICFMTRNDAKLYWENHGLDLL